MANNNLREKLVGIISSRIKNIPIAGDFDRTRAMYINDSAIEGLADLILSKIVLDEEKVNKHMESICEQVHKAYCEYKLKATGEEYWTKGDYSKLNEEGKEYDRRTVRAVIKTLTTTPDILTIRE